MLSVLIVLCMLVGGSSGQAYTTTTDRNTVNTTTTATTSFANPTVIDACLESQNCWLKYPFLYNKTWITCGGTQYVTKYKEYYVGVVLCNSTTYKIYMSDVLNWQFKSIGYSRGDGKNHCQFVGATYNYNAVIDMDNNVYASPTTTGYFRSFWSLAIHNGTIGATPHNTGRYYGRWYKCGVTIPGSKYVVDFYNVKLPSGMIISTSTPAPSISEAVYSCLSRSNCWLKYSFTYDDNWNSCHGDQYVTMYRRYYIGVILCSSKKYKLFMSESLFDEFLNIADSNGNGRDHCQFVGAKSKDHVVLPDDFWDSPATYGYWRAYWNESIKKGRIGGSPSSSQWTGKYYVKWYKCGVNIPSDDVVIYNGEPLHSPTPSRPTTTTVPVAWIYQECLMDSNCWLEFAFNYNPKFYYYCGGPQYVTKYKQYYLGVVVCKPTRYKIFMSESLFGTFLNIGDSNGYGKDHCEFLGARSTSYGIKVDMRPRNSSNAPGFYRSNWGERLQKGLLGGIPTYTGRYYGQWYECGVSIPGNKRVLHYRNTTNTVNTTNSVRTKIYTWPTVATTTLNINTQYPCNPVMWPATAQAIPTTAGSTTYGCNLCSDSYYEVHVIKMYKSSAESTTKMEIKSLRSNLISIKLVLMTYEPTKWQVISPENVKIMEIRLASHYADQSSVSVVSREHTETVIRKDKNTYFDSFTDIVLLKQYVIKAFGFISSYTGVDQASGWKLYVGSCDVPKNSDVEKKTESVHVEGSSSSSSHGFSSATSIPVILGIVVGVGVIICVVAGTAVVIIFVCLQKQQQNSGRTTIQGNPSRLWNQHPGIIRPGGAHPYQQMPSGQNSPIQATGQAVQYQINHQPHTVVGETNLSMNGPQTSSPEVPQYRQVSDVPNPGMFDNQIGSMDSIAPQISSSEVPQYRQASDVPNPGIYDNQIGDMDIAKNDATEVNEPAVVEGQQDFQNEPIISLEPDKIYLEVADTAQA